MRILFVQQWVGAAQDANSALAQNIQQALGKAGHTVLVMGEPTGHRPLRQDEGTILAIENSKSRRLRQVYARISTAAPLAKIGLYLKNPAALAATVARRLFGREWWASIYKKEIEAACRQYPVDAVVAVAAPYFTARALAAADIPAKKLLYMLDPYATSQVNREPFRVQIENKTLAQLSGVLVTPLLYSEYEKHPTLGRWLFKMQPSEFPAFCQDPKTTAPLFEGLLPENRITCVYAGSFYPHIRSPRPLLRFFEALDDARIQLVLFCGQATEAPSFWQEAQDRLKGRLTLQDPVAPAVLRTVLARADVLVNLGNQITNQLPSKLMEYIGTGKPILNLYQTPHCPSLPYLEKYPLAVSIALDRTDTGAVEQARRFCLEAAGRQLQNAQGISIFPTATPEYVAGQLLGLITDER